MLQKNHLKQNIFLERTVKILHKNLVGRQPEQKPVLLAPAREHRARGVVGGELVPGVGGGRGGSPGRVDGGRRRQEAPRRGRWRGRGGGRVGGARPARRLRGDGGRGHAGGRGEGRVQKAAARRRRGAGLSPGSEGDGEARVVGRLREKGR
jgi:hypothetical protein